MGTHFETNMGSILSKVINFYSDNSQLLLGIRKI